MADEWVDTAMQRDPTGLDQGARELIVKLVIEVGNLGPDSVVELFFRDRFGEFDDYFAPVSEVWGEATSPANAGSEYAGNLTTFGGWRISA
jgi:hypothetical protein